MKRIIAVLLLMMIALFCVTSCFQLTGDHNTPSGDQGKPDGDGGNDGGSDDGNDDSGYERPDYGAATVFLPGDRVQIISPTTVLSNKIKDEIDKYLVYNGVGGAAVGNYYSPNEELEILVNIEDVDKSRPIVEKANRLLNRVEKDSYFEMRYLIYAESGQIAVAFDQNEYTHLQPDDYVVDELIAELVKNKDYYATAAGVVKSGTIDLISIQEEIDLADVTQQWIDLEAAAQAIYGKEVGTEITDAFRVYYSMMSDDVVDWWAYMFDPGIGGFYATASGRDHLGFLPNIEATGQILTHLGTSGMLDNFRGSTAIALPKLMQYRIVYYYKSLQNPSNGYFYNPQLGISGTSTYRLGRDQGRCTSWLETFGSAPTYTHPTGVKGDGITADEYWDDLVERGLIDPDVERPYVPKSLEDYADRITGNLNGDSPAEAVSKIVSVADASGAEVFLESHEEFEKWLFQWNIDANPYSGCSNINATYKIIGAASDKLGPAGEAGKWYDGMTLKDMTIKYLNDHINGRGLFGAYQENSSDPSAGCKYANTNGLMKAIPIYSAWKIAYPEPLKAVEGCLIGIMSDEKSTGNICETYNIWEALSGVLSNVKQYGSDELERELIGYYDAENKVQVYGSIYTSLGELAPEAILNTYNKQKNYQTEGGGFSHSVTNGAKEHGGCPVGLGIKENNCDANGFGMQSVINAMLSCLSLRDYQVPVYTESDFMRFLEIIFELDPVIKYSYDEENNAGSLDKVFTFEEGLPASGFSVSSTNASNTYTQVNAVGKDGEKGILRVTKTQDGSGNGMTLISNATVKSAIATMTTFELDVKYSNLTQKSESQIQVGTLSKTSMKTMPIFILLTFGGTADGSKIFYSDYENGSSKKQNIDTGAVVGEWFTLRVEYYQGDANTFRFRTYVNDKLIYTSNSIYSQNIYAGADVIPTAYEIQRATFSMNEKFKGTFEFDNISLIQSRGTLDDMGVGQPGNTEVPEDKPTEPEEVIPEAIPEGIRTPAAADAVNFDTMPYETVTKITSQDFLNTVQIVEAAGGGKVLYVNKPSYIDSNSGVIFRQYPTKVEEKPTVAVFEADFLLKKYTATGVIQFTLSGAATGNNNTPLMLLLSPSSAAEGAVVKYNSQIYDETAGKNTGNPQIATEAKVGEWFRFRYEYYVTATDKDGVPTAIEYKAYVNNVLVETQTDVYGKNLVTNGGTTLIPTVDELSMANFSFNAGNKGVFAVDNFSFRKLAVNDYVPGKLDIPEPSVGSGFKAPEGSITFSENLDNMISAGKVKIDLKDSTQNTYSIVTVNGDKMLSLNKTDNSKQELLLHNVTKEAGSYDTVTYEAVLSYAPAEGQTNGELEVSLLDKNLEKIVYTYIKYNAEGNLQVIAYKRVASGTTNSGAVTPTVPVKAGDFFKIRIEYQLGKAEDCTKIYINDELLISGAYYSGTLGADGKYTDNLYTEVGSGAVLNYTKFVGTTLIDYSYLEAKKGSTDTPPVQPDVPTGDKETGPVVTFDKDYTDLITVATNPDFAELNKWQVVEVEGNKTLFIDKAGKDTSGTSWNGGVTLTVKVTEKEEDAKVAVLEFDLTMKEMTAIDSQITLNHSGKTGKKTSPFLLTLPKKFDEKLHITVIYKPTATDAAGKVTAFEASIRANNDEPTVVTEIFGQASELLNGNVPLPKVSDVDSIVVALNNSFLGDAYFDNVSFRLLKEYVAPEVPHEHVFVDGKCECGAEDPNYVDPDAPSVPEVAPGTDNGVINFDSDYTGNLTVVTNPSFAELNKWEVVEVEGNKTLFIDKAGKDTSGTTYNGGVSLRLGVTYSEKDANAAVAEFDLTMTNVTGFASQITMAHQKSLASNISPFMLQLPKVYDQKLHITIIYKITETAADGTPTAIEHSIKVNDEEATVSTEIYGAKLKDGSVALPKLSQIDYVVIALNNAFLGDAYFDNMSLKLVKLDDSAEEPETPHEHVFVDGKCECGAEDPNYVAPEAPVENTIVNFDQMPAITVVKISSAWESSRDTYAKEGKTLKGENSWEITTLADVGSVLYINKQCGGVVEWTETNDNGTPDDTTDDTTTTKTYQDYNTGVVISQSVMATEKDANVAIFEADFMYKSISYNDVLQFTLLGSSAGNANAAIFATAKPASVDAGAVISLTDYGYNGGNVLNEAVKTGAKVGEWFHVRVEYRVTATDADGNATAVEVTYNFGGVEYVSTTGYRKLMNVADIKSFNFSINARNVGEYYMDNTTLKLVYEEPKAPHEHVYVDGKCECGESDPNYVPPHEHVYVDGKCECGAEDPNYVAPEAPVDNSVITFDKDYADFITIATNSSFAELNKWQVVEVEGDKALFIDKAGKDTSGTTYNGGVSLTIKPTKVDENANLMVLEFDLTMKEMTAVDSQMTLNHGSYTGKNTSPFLLQLPKNRYNEKLHFTITYKVTASDDNGVPTAIEYSIQINDEAPTVDTVPYAKATKLAVNGGTVALPKVSEITSIVVALNNSFLGDAYFDNVSFRLEYVEPEAPDAPHEHVYVDGKCECGESDPNYVPPHEHVYVDGKCECGESDPNYVAPEAPVDPDLITFDEIPAQVTFGPTTVKEISADPKNASNKVLKVTAASMKADGTAVDTKSMYQTVADVPADAEVAVFRTKVLWENVNRMTAEIYLVNSSKDTGKANRAVFVYFNGASINTYENGKGGPTVSSGGFVSGEWVDVRIEYRVVTVDGAKLPEIKVYVGESCVMTSNVLYGTDYYTTTTDATTGESVTKVNSDAIPTPGSINKWKVNVSNSVNTGYIYFDDLKFDHE